MFERHAEEEKIQKKKESQNLLGFFREVDLKRPSCYTRDFFLVLRGLVFVEAIFLCFKLFTKY